MNAFRLASLLALGAAAGVALLGACATRRASPPPVARGPALPRAAVPAPASALEVRSPWTLDTSVGRIVAQRPATARVFEKAGIDYCCGGEATLGAAAAAAGVDAAEVLAALRAVHDAPTPASERPWLDAPLPELLTHVEATHHAYLREELPRLSEIVRRVHEVHGDAHPELAEVATVYEGLARDLPPHLDLEERRVFPAVLALSKGDRAASAEALETIRRMRSEHDGAGAAMHRLRETTRGYAVPDDACALYRQMLSGLLALEEDLHRHVHLENNVLAPRAEALARR